MGSDPDAATQLRSALADYDPEILVADGLESAFVGIIHRCGQAPFAVYDRAKVLEHLEAQGMDEDEAIEFFEFNVVGAWVGEYTPGFLATLDWEG